MQTIASPKTFRPLALARGKNDSHLTQICQPSSRGASFSQCSVKLVKSSASGRVNLSKPRQTLTVCSAASTNGAESKTVPKPKVRIDNLRDPMATVVIIEYGDMLGELLDTVAALQNLGLNIVKAKLDSVDEKDGPTKHRFYVTDAQTSEKLFDSEKLEEIRITIINMMVTFHPEASDDLRSGVKSTGALVPDSSDDMPLGPKETPVIPTSIRISADGSGARTRLDVVTTDRPGLLVDIVGTLKDVSVNVLSAEVDTIGLMAHDSFFLTYQGTALSSPMEELVQNALYYYLVLGEGMAEESY